MSLTQNLISHMETAQSVIDSLIKTSSKQLEALDKNDLKLLNETIQEQNLMTRELKVIEKEIISSQQKLAQQLELTEYNLAEIVVRIDSKLAERLTQIQGNTKAKLEKLKQTNELNNMIVKQNLAYTQKIMQAIGQLNDQGHGQTYSQQGQVKSEPNNSLLNKQV